MNPPLGLRLTALLACAALGPAAAATMGKEAFKAQQEHIEAEYDAAQTRCKQLAGHSRAVCMAQARGARDVAAAELQMRHRPSPENDENVRLARAEATYAVALQKCKALDGQARAVCRADARTVFTAAKADAKLQREVVAQQMRSEALVRERQDAAGRDAKLRYQAARQRCGMLPAEGRENCLEDARRRFGQL